MSTYGIRSYNVLFSNIYTSDLEIITNRDADSTSYSSLGTTSGGFVNAEFDFSQVVSAQSKAQRSAGPTNNIAGNDAFIAEVNWGTTGQNSSTIMLIGNYNDFIADFVGTYTLVAIGGDDITSLTDAVSVLETLSNPSIPGAPFTAGTSIDYSQLDSFLSVTQNDEMSGSSVKDTFYGGAGNDTLMGESGNDKLFGGYGNDEIFGGSGDDYVKVGGGIENFDGGSGKDYISYYDSAGGVNINLGANTASGGWAANDTVINFESISGSNVGGDKIYGTSGSNTIKTYGGDDKVYAGNGADKVYLGSGDDYVKVGGGAESFFGGSGTDYISYYDSADGVDINLATNTASGSWAVNDTIDSFEGISGSKLGGDKIVGTSGANIIKTYGGNDKVMAGNGADKVYLGSGDDYVKVGGGAESFFGGSGTDYISYYDSTGGIRIDLQADTVSGSWAVNDKIENFEGASGSKTGGDMMLGTSGANTMKSYGGNDKLYGRSGNDKLYGGDGADRFDGGAGTDLLYGGAGSDVFHFDHGEDHDIIKDFENNIDTIQLDNFTFGANQDAFDFASQSGLHVVFDFGGGDKLTIENTTLGHLYNDIEMV